jgi:hypothetical protein
MIILPGRELMPLIRAALERGQCVRLTANGSSMLPFIYNGETVELVPPRSSLMRGDIVLAQTAEDRYVLHRVVQIEGDAVFLRGDAQNHREGPLPRQAVLGRAVTCSHHGRVRVQDRGGWHWAGLVWMRSGWLGFYLLQFALRLRGLGSAIRRRLSLSKKNRTCKPCLKS